MTLGGQTELKTSFAPVADAGARLLVLGSLPGDLSLRRGQYYGHPQNQFWRLMGAVLGQDLPSLDYPARLAMLQARGVALWDVVRSARRAGSLDAAIRDHEPNRLAEFARGLPRLAAIAFNGAKAAQLGRRALAGEGAWTLLDLPSSSPAYAAVPFTAKLVAWRALAPFVDGAGGG